MMFKLILVLTMTITGFCSCQKPGDTVLSKNISADNILRPPQVIQKIDFSKSDTTIVFGDSWCDYKFYSNNFIKLFSDTTDQKIINDALIGLGSANMVSKAFQTMNTTRNDKNVITLSGFNDVRYAGATQEIINFEKNAYRAVLANQFLDTWRPAGDADRFGGQFISFEQSFGVNFKSFYSNGKKGAYSPAVEGVFLEYNFSGNNVGVSFVGQDTTALGTYDRPFGRWRVLIDGVVIDTPSIHQETCGHMPGYMTSQVTFPAVKIYSGLSDGHHILRLEPVDEGNKFVDFIFTLRDPSLVYPIAIMKVPYMTQQGYTIDPYFNKASDAAIDKVNAAITEVRDEFIRISPGYSKKIRLINTSSYFNKNKDYLPDLIHPNALGQFNLLASLKDYISY